MGSLKQKIQPGGSSGNPLEDGNGRDQDDSLQSNRSRLKWIGSFQERLLHEDEMNGGPNGINSIENSAQLRENLEMILS